MNTRYLRTRIGVTILLLMLIIIFAAQNAAVIDIRFLAWRFDIRRSVLIFSVLVIGIVMGWSSRVIYRVMKK